MEASDVLRIAQAEIGYTETPTNRTKYGQAYGMDGVDWCAIFQWWVFTQAGASALFYGGGKCASCTAYTEWAVKAGAWTTSGYRAGDLILFDFKHRGYPSHIGLLESIDGNTLVTIEGNTSSGDAGSQDNGGGVHRRKRKLADVYGAARPAYAKEGSGVRRYNYDSKTYIVEIDRTDIAKLDIAMCVQPTGTIDDLYKRDKPDVICNAGFFALSTGETAFTVMDDGVVYGGGTYPLGLCIVGAAGLTLGEISEVKGTRDFVSAFPVLVRDGKRAELSYAQEINYPARRTAIGWTDNSLWIVGVTAPGCKLEHLQDVFQTLGADDAVNLDGGGSSRILVGGESILTDQTYNRPVDSAFAVYLRKETPEPEKEDNPLEEKTVTLSLTERQIKALQTVLALSGHPCGATGADGKFGAKSKAALYEACDDWSALLKI